MKNEHTGTMLWYRDSSFIMDFLFQTAPARALFRKAVSDYAWNDNFLRDDGYPFYCGNLSYGADSGSFARVYLQDLYCFAGMGRIFRSAVFPHGAGKDKKRTDETESGLYGDGYSRYGPDLCSSDLLLSGRYGRLYLWTELHDNLCVCASVRFADNL